MYQPQFHQHRIPSISFQFPGLLLELEDALEFHDRSNTLAVIQSHSHTVIGKKKSQFAASKVFLSLELRYPFLKSKEESFGCSTSPASTRPRMRSAKPASAGFRFLKGIGTPSSVPQSGEVTSKKPTAKTTDVFVIGDACWISRCGWKDEAKKPPLVML